MATKKTKNKQHRPFYTVIIPCYNTKPDYMSVLLNSLTHQGIDNDDLEVIISDDCSSDLSYKAVVEDFKNRGMHIKETSTKPEAVHCPGNNRENGVQLATGEWIVFADHDDLFTDNAFANIRVAIEAAKEEYFVAANFAEVDPYDLSKVIRTYVHTQNWMHVKFYNLDNFWKAKNFHFVKDLMSHEDIAVSSKTHCELYRIGRKNPLFVDIIAYLWRAHPDSESRKPLGLNGFIEEYFDDYLASTGGVYIKDYYEYLENPIVSQEDHRLSHLRLAIDVILYMYFYIQAFKFNTPGEYKLKNEFTAKEYIRKVVEVFNTNREFIYDQVSENSAYWYNAVRESAIIGTGAMVEIDSFKDFLYK